jgi:hypothetical protein
MRYIKQTYDHGLLYTRHHTAAEVPVEDEFQEMRWKRGYAYTVYEDDDVLVQGYGDASFAPQAVRAMAGDEAGESPGEDLTFGIRAVTGITVTIGGNLVNWSSRRQSVTAISTAEAELNGQVSTLAALLGVAQIVQELGIKHRRLLRCDNAAALAMVRGSTSCKTRYLAMRAAVIRDHVMTGQTDMAYIETSRQLADIMTKALGRIKHAAFMELLGMTTKKGHSQTRVSIKMAITDVVTSTASNVVAKTAPSLTNTLVDWMSSTMSNVVTKAISTAMMTVLLATPSEVPQCPPCPPCVNDEDERRGNDNTNHNNWSGFGLGVSSGVVGTVGAQGVYQRIRKRCCPPRGNRSTRLVREVGSQSQVTFHRGENSRFVNVGRAADQHDNGPVVSWQ